PINPIPPGIVEADFDLEEEIRFVENLSYDNSSPRPPEELNSKISDVTTESFSPSPIPIEDSDSLIEEIDTFLASDDLIPPVDLYDDPSSPRPPEKPPDDDGICFDTQPDTGDVAAKVVEDIFDNSSRELRVHMPNVLPTQPTFCLDEDFTFVIRIFLPFLFYSVTSSFLLPFGSEDTIFDP
ncbi:hypothetical protein Tco_0263434, partial [Tanacetum coccineum]